VIRVVAQRLHRNTDEHLEHLFFRVAALQALAVSGSQSAELSA
jgi:hypothetical protein